MIRVGLCLLAVFCFAADDNVSKAAKYQDMDYNEYEFDNSEYGEIDKQARNATYFDKKKSGDYELVIISDQPIRKGSNSITITLFKHKKIVNAKSAKAKCFIPESTKNMYMERHASAKKVKNGVSFVLDVDLEMKGKWICELRVKDKKEKLIKFKDEIIL